MMSSMHSKAMQVPDRIILTGRDHHVGTTALPRELQLENIVMPPDTEQIRIQTPPRTITLNDTSYLPMSNYSHPRSIEVDDETLIVENNQARFMSNIPNGRIGGGIETSVVPRNRDASVTGYFDSEELQAEMEHLREQMSRLNARLLSVEDEVNNSKERETYLIIGALLYITIHACSWLFRSNR